MSQIHSGKIAPEDTSPFARGFVPYWRKFEYDYADLDAANSIMFPVEAGDFIMAVAHKVVTSFDTGSDVIIGDSADADGWFKTTNLTPQTEGNFLCSLGRDTSTYGAYSAVGKTYSATNYIKITFDEAIAAGAGELYVLMSGLEGA